MSKNVPKLRFKKIDGSDYPEWESKKVSEIFTFYSTNSLSRDKLADKKTEMKNIHYGDIHTKFGSILDVDKMELPYIKEESLSSIKNYTEAIDGDVFIADASEDYADIGKATEINNVNDAKIVGGLHVLHLRDEKEIYVNGIKGFLFNSPHIRNQIKIVAVGSKVLGLSKPGLGGLEISIMPKEEQSKIAGFFSAIDSRITNQSSKLDSLQELKKGVMQKIFSQEIRFKREDGGEYPDWEYTTLKNCCRYLGDGDWIESKDQSNEGFRIIQTGNIGVGFFKEKADRARFVSPETFNRLNCKEVFPGDILISRLPDPVGRACIIPETPGVRYITAVDCTIVKTNEAFIEDYLIQFLTSPDYFKDVERDLAGSTRVRISRKNLEEIAVSKPIIEEQQKIADFLSTLDSKISLESQILETLQTLKKGLLQQMFV